MAQKKSIVVAQEFYDGMENLKLDPNFIKFKEVVVEPAIASLAENVLHADLSTKELRDKAISDIRLYQRTLNQYETFFQVAHDQAKLIRKTIKDREKREKEEMA